jgi:hypothetical protein
MIQNSHNNQSQCIRCQDENAGSEAVDHDFRDKLAVSGLHVYATAKAVGQVILSVMVAVVVGHG